MRKLISLAKGMSWQNWIFNILFISFFLILGQCTVHKALNEIKKDQQTKAYNQDRALREKLSKMREEAEYNLTMEERQLNEELSKLPDEIPSARRLARACRELRNDGYAELPPICGHSEN